ncbi:MAG: hypothetical protein BGO41_09400 [Clostridiales bacterium 38-18]|nr:MAG: hypothetical protein BGO41_09400 [Clostridiales bacterium 38-18]
MSSFINTELNKDTRNILFIVNPVAGNGKTKEILPLIKAKLNPHKDHISYKIIISKFKGDIISEVKKHYDQGYREFVAVGGDGTLSELINGFILPLNDKPTIGIIPMGTGNDFVRNLDSNRDLDKIFQTIIDLKSKTIDVGVVNNYYFLNVCSFGIDGPIIEDTDRLKKYIPGQGSYLLSTIKAGLTFKASEVYLKYSGQTIKEKMILVAIGNGKYFGGGMKIFPEARLDDGYLDMVKVKNVGKVKFVKEMSKIYTGKLDQVEEVAYSKITELEIDNEEKKYWINADGNLVGRTPAKVKIIKEGIKYFATDLV